MSGYLSQIVQRSQATGVVRGAEPSAPPAAREPLQDQDAPSGYTPGDGPEGPSTMGPQLQAGPAQSPELTRQTWLPQTPGLTAEGVGYPLIGGKPGEPEKHVDPDNPAPEQKSGTAGGHQGPPPDLHDPGGPLRIPFNVIAEKPRGRIDGNDGESSVDMEKAAPPSQVMREEIGQPAAAPDATQAATPGAASPSKLAPTPAAPSPFIPAPAPASRPAQGPALLIGKITVEVIQPAAVAATLAAAARNRRPRASRPASPPRRQPGEGGSKLGFGLGQL
jgi:hypothetical protein